MSIALIYRSFTRKDSQDSHYEPFIGLFYKIIGYLFYNADIWSKVQMTARHLPETAKILPDDSPLMYVCNISEIKYIYRVIIDPIM